MEQVRVLVLTTLSELDRLLHPVLLLLTMMELDTFLHPLLILMTMSDLGPLSSDAPDDV